MYKPQGIANAIAAVAESEAAFITRLVFKGKQDELQDYLISVLGLDSMTEEEIWERWLLPAQNKLDKPI